MITQTGSARRLLQVVVIGALLGALVGAGTLVGHGQPLAAAKPKPGGTVTVPLTSYDCIDPARSGELQAVYVAAAYTDTLVAQDAKGTFIPDLAIKWKFSKDGKTLTLSLRQGVKFSNGDKFTAASVKFNLTRPENVPSVGPVKSIKTVGSYTVVITLKSPFRPLLSNLAYLVPIVDPKSVVKSDCDNMIAGTGPFKITSVGPGLSSITMQRNRFHTWSWSYGLNKGPAYLSTLQWSNSPDPTTSVTELLSGALDIVNVGGTQLSRVQGNPDIKLYRQLGQNITWLGFNHSKAPFNNPAVRRAIAEAIDKNAIVQGALNGQGKPASSMIASTVSFFDKNSTKYAIKYNPSAARSTLAANHITGPYTLLSYSSAPYSTVAELIQAQLQQVGVTVNVVTKPLANYFPAATAGDFDMNLASYTAVDPDFLYGQLDSSQEGPDGGNYTFYKNAKLDSLLRQSRVTVRSKQAASIYAAIQKFVDTQVIEIPLYTPIGTVGVRTRVGGFHRNVWGLFPVHQDLYIKK